MVFGVAATSAVAAGVVMAAIQAAVTGLARLFLGERIEPRVPAAIACAATGFALLALAKAPVDGSAAATPWWGYALLLGAVVCEASYLVIDTRLPGQVSSRRISALTSLWGLALVTPFGAWQARRFEFAAVGAPTRALLFFCAIAASIVTAWLWMHGVRHMRAPQAGVFTVMLPVSAALLGVLFLGEPFGAGHLAAFALALLGLLLATWPGRDEAAR
jgi:drug/metabolite transporter (DMT)-like permease